MKELFVNTTNKCINLCPFCYNQGLVYEDITLEYFQKILAYINSEITKVTFIGGEPLCHPQILPLLELTLSHNFRTTLWTSGVIPCDAFLDGIKELRVSRNAPTDEDCSKIFGRRCISRKRIAKYGDAVKLVITCIPGLGGITNTDDFWKWYEYYSICEPLKFLILPVNSKDNREVDRGVSITNDIRPYLPNNVFEEIDYENDMKPGWNDFYTVGNVLYRSFTEGNSTRLIKLLDNKFFNKTVVE